MTYGAGTYDFIPVERGHFSRETFSHTVSGAVALTLSMLVGGLILYAHSTATHYAQPEIAYNFEGAPPTPPPMSARVVYAPPPATALKIIDKPPAGTPAAVAASDEYIALLDPTYSLGGAPGPLEQSAPLRPAFEPFPSALPAQVAEAEDVGPAPMPPMPEQFVQGVPLPAPRPSDLDVAASHGPAHARAREMAENRPILAPADHPSFFEKLFGWSQSSGPALAYAAPEDGSEEPKAAVPYDHWTAVYDISAHTVYLPDGTRLEAHSGLGAALDDPRYVSEHMRGPTPPGTYDLQPREQLFHGVQALRLIPVGNSDTYGRAGLLAHTFMLGQNGDSFGCVSFRNYQAFLRAYESGEVRRLTVVARMD
ncbi:MAG: tlde1 domain-containing protein [Methylovirgula sp.]